MIGEALPVVPLGLGILWVWDVYKRVGPLALFCFDLERFPPIAGLPRMYGMIHHLNP